MKKIIQSLILMCLTLICTYVQSEDDILVEIDKIVITETRDESDISDTNANQTIQITATPNRSRTVAETVAKTPGVHIRRFGTVDEDSVISIRGSTPQQVEVFVDDIPLQSASEQGHSLAKFLVGNVSKLEVFKSITPVSLGVAPVGGTIRISTRDVQPGLHHRHGLGFGSFLSFDAFSEFSRGSSDHDIAVGLQYRRTKGNFRFLDDNGTPLNSSDDSFATRSNNESQTVHPYVKWTYRFDERTRLKWTSHFLRTDEGVPGVGVFQASSADLSTTEFLSQLRIDRKPEFSDKVQLNNQMYLRWIKSQFTDLAGELGLGAAQDNDNSTTIVGDRFNWRTEFSEIVALSHALEGVFEWYVPKDFARARTYGTTSKRQQLNFGTEAELCFFDRKFNVVLLGQSLNAFYNINNDDPTLLTPATFFSERIENNFAGTAALDYSPVRNLHFKSSLARTVRQPKFMELFGDQGGVVGNPQLLSEKAIKFDAGILWVSDWESSLFDKFKIDASYFESRMNDLIQFELGSGFSRASNLGRALIRGVEASASVRFLEMLRWNFGYTFQWSKDQATQPGNSLIGRPMHELNSEWIFEKKGWFASFDLNYMDRQYLDALNTQVVRHRVILNATTGYSFNNHWRLSLQANNLTNSQVVDSVGFPLPGRNFYGRVDYSY